MLKSVEMYNDINVSLLHFSYFSEIFPHKISHLNYVWLRFHNSKRF